jgi:hypothetical protein
MQENNIYVCGVSAEDVALLLNNENEVPSDDLSHMLPPEDTSSGVVNDALNRLIQNDRDDHDWTVARAIYSTLQSAIKVIREEVTNIRNLRAEEARRLRNLEMLNHAIDSAKVTLNYKPVLQILSSMRESALTDLGKDPSQHGLPPFPKKEKKAAK